MNKCSFIGRLTKDIELRYAQSGTAIANFTLAVNRRFKQEGQPNADFLNFVAFGKTSEFIAKYFSKGSAMGVIARVQTRNWEDDQGKKHYVTEFIVEEVDFAGNNTNGNQSSNDNNDLGTEIDDENLPF